MVLLPRNNEILIETLWYAIYGIYIQLFDGKYYKLVEAIYYNIFGSIKQVFNEIFDGTFYNRNEIIII